MYFGLKVTEGVKEMSSKYFSYCGDSGFDEHDTEEETTTTTKVIEFKEGETVNLRSLRKYEAIGIDLKGGYLESYKSETGVLSATFTKDCTITIEVK